MWILANAAKKAINVSLGEALWQVLGTGVPWNQTQCFTLVIQGFSVLVAECMCSRISVLRNHCRDLHVTLDSDLFIMHRTVRQFMSYKFPKPHKLWACFLDLLEVSQALPQLSTEFHSLTIQEACVIHTASLPVLRRYTKVTQNSPSGTPAAGA